MAIFSKLHILCLIKVNQLKADVQNELVGPQVGRTEIVHPGEGSRFGLRQVIALAAKGASVFGIQAAVFCKWSAGCVPMR